MKKLREKWGILFFILFFNPFGLRAEFSNYYADVSVMPIPAKFINANLISFELFTHGRSGELLINGQWLGKKEIASFLTNKITTHTKHINIYGCEFAKGEKGLSAIKYLEEKLQLSISASNNITGKDGDWVLEVGKRLHVTNIKDYAFNLQCPPITVSDPDSDGDGIANSADVDDDNDGILDSYEGAPNSTSFAMFEPFSYSLYKGPMGTYGLKLPASSDLECACTGETGELYDGRYALVTDPSWETGYWGPPGTNNDHTGDGGLMMAINSSHDGGERLYSQNINNIPPGSTVSISFWVKNFCNPANGSCQDLPDIGVRFKDLSNNQLYFNNSGSIPYTGNWMQYSFTTVTGTDPNFIFEIINNCSCGESGNDFALDDILLTYQTGTAGVDTDSDGVPDYLDLDSDNDGIPDAIEACGNIGLTLESCRLDADGDAVYPDTNGDGCPDGLVQGACPFISNKDGDGIPDFRDTDSDGDGCSDSNEAGINPDLSLGVDPNGLGNTGCAVPTQTNYINSAIKEPCVICPKPTAMDADSDMDGVPNSADLDDDNDGMDDSVEGVVDTDGDGVLNYLDLDSDNDGLPDAAEGCRNWNNNWTNCRVPYDIELDTDENTDDCADGRPKRNNCNPVDTDNDGVPDYLDTNSDGDLCSDATESGRTTSGVNNNLTNTYSAVAVDANGIPSSAGCEWPTNGDWREKFSNSACALSCLEPTEFDPDHDGDGVPESLDLDDDNDGIPDTIECPTITFSNAVFQFQNGSTSEGDYNHQDSPNTFHWYNYNDINSNTSLVESGLSDDNFPYFIFDNSDPNWTLNRFEFTVEHANDVGLHMLLFAGINSSTSAQLPFNSGFTSYQISWEASGYRHLASAILHDPANQTNLGDGALIKNNDVLMQTAELNNADIQWYIEFPLGVYRININAIGGNGKEAFRVGMRKNICVDTDGDGVSNNVDLDSDNDGIPDAVEACGNTSLSLESCRLDNNGDANYGTTALGCRDGLVVGACVSAVDTDNDGTADYLDLNSDNDICLDMQEAGISGATYIDNNTGLTNIGCFMPANNDWQDELVYQECFKVHPDVNITFVNVPVEGSLFTNDHIPLGSLYGAPTAISGNPDGSLPVINSNGTYSFNSPTLRGVFHFNVSVCPPGQTMNCPIERLTITVQGTVGDNPPIANTDLATTHVNTAVTLRSLSNDSKGINAPDLDPSSVTVKQDPLHGTAMVDLSTGNITYTPNPGFTGVDTLKYEVCDAGSPRECKEALQIITITASSSNITSASDDFGLSSTGNPVTGNLLNNDVDVENNSRTVTAIDTTIAGVGRVEISGNGAYTFTPTPGYSGPAHMPYKVCDNGAPQACDSATLYLLILGSSASTLPVTIHDIVAQSVSKSAVKVSWTVSNEELFSHYELERALQQSNAFSKIAHVQAAGKAAYSYIDSIKQTDRIYYRLKLVDLNGQYRYSKVVLLSGTNAVGSSLKLFPNPAHSQTTLDYYAVKSGLVTINVIDMSGKIVETKRYAAALGNNLIKLEGLSKLPRGVYQVQIQQNAEQQNVKMNLQ